MYDRLVKMTLGISLSLALLLSSVPASAVGPTGSDGVPVPGNEAAPQPSATFRVTLITGDVVTVTKTPDGKQGIAIAPADPTRLGQHFASEVRNGDTYVFPDGVDLNRLDKELFNVDYLVRDEYYRQPSLPVLVTHQPGLQADRIRSFENGVQAVGEKTTFHAEVASISTNLAYGDISVAYDTLVGQPDVSKIWLDKKLHVQLGESVPLIGAPSFWASGYNGTGVEIAILDSGIDDTHPALDDLDDNPATSDPKVVVSVNFTDDGTVADLFGHGTHVAGIASGTRGSSNITGVAPAARLWNVKVLNRYGWGYESWIIDGVNYASLGPDGLPRTGDEADIISMSLGGGITDGTDPMSQAVNLAWERGVTVIIAAGNSGSGMYTVGTPGAAEKVITVGASDKNDKLAWFSSRGPTTDLRIKPDILAPGVNIISSVTTNPVAVINDPSGYKSLSGTSMATPHVAGAAALLLQATGGNATPQFMKDMLMSTSKDMGYSVYEQGAGRIDLSSGNGTLLQRVRVTPAELNLGSFSSANDTAGGSMTFVNMDNVSHQVELKPVLTDVFAPPVPQPAPPATPPGTETQNSADGYAENVSLSQSVFTIPPSSNVTVSFSVNLTSLPASLFSGKITAVVDNTTSIHGIFGFSKMRRVQAHKTDVNGTPAEGHNLQLFAVSPYSFQQYFENAFNSSGDFVFYVPDGSYHVVSYNWGHDTAQTPVTTIAENVTVSGDTSIELDERDTMVIDFNPGNPGLIPSSKFSLLFYDGYASASYCWYPQTFVSRVSPIAEFNAGFNYNGYPLADVDEENHALINTSEWLNLLYPADNISDNITFVADYGNLVYRETGYGTAVNGERTVSLQWSFSPINWYSWTFDFQMDAPQVRREWLSPRPIQYLTSYRSFMAEPGDSWVLDSEWLDYPSGNASGTIGYHPLTSGADVALWGDTLRVFGFASRDAAHSALWGKGVSGHLKVTENGTSVVLDTDTADSFDRSVAFTGKPAFGVEVWGSTPFELAPTSYTRLDFVADAGRDWRPPRLEKIIVPSINASGVVPGGQVKVGVKVWDESPLSDIVLHYSLADNSTTIDAGPPVLENGVYVFDLGGLQQTFVSIAIDATDQYGNHIRRMTDRAFYVDRTPLTVSIVAPDRVVPGSNFTARVEINEVDHLDAANYDVSFNPSVLTLQAVTAGSIGSGGNWTAIPVDIWSVTGSGRYTIVQNVPGFTGVSGSGSLATLHFTAIGALGSSSDITLSNGALSTGNATELIAAWAGDFVAVSVMQGDATGDSKVNAVDITKVERIVVGLDSPTPGADANLDGAINSLDITKVERIIAKLDPAPVPPPPPTPPPGTGPPVYGGTITIARASDITEFDEVLGSQAAAPTLQLTNEELIRGDWAKGPAGSNETSWTLQLDRWEHKKGYLAEGWQVG